ncbi:hypothetical protein L484_019411 [Morus notabilis]|uniref:Uncharacterized protein n=1 Tax=Morus notabilis TaxID=981085 RepID=W9SFH4_9ROSA|nr:hypothetical protein L484_019411 [Morus notabilis]
MKTTPFTPLLATAERFRKDVLNGRNVGKADATALTRGASAALTDARLRLVLDERCRREVGVGVGGGAVTDTVHGI